jgi:hypothetical protein
MQQELLLIFNTPLILLKIASVYPQPPQIQTNTEDTIILLLPDLFGVDIFL